MPRKNGLERRQVDLTGPKGSPAGLAQEAHLHGDCGVPSEKQAPKLRAFRASVFGHGHQRLFGHEVGRLRRNGREVDSKSHCLERLPGRVGGRGPVKENDPRRLDQVEADPV